MNNTVQSGVMLPDEVTDNTSLHRFELHGDGQTAVVVYERAGDLLRLIHTEVPQSLEGKGVGSKLVSAVLRFAEENNLSVVPLCPFVAQYVKRHPKYAAIVDPAHRWMIDSAS
jgi:predicted GNAT family acetyltransferase